MYTKAVLQQSLSLSHTRTLSHAFTLSNSHSHSHTYTHSVCFFISIYLYQYPHPQPSLCVSTVATQQSPPHTWCSNHSSTATFDSAGSGASKLGGGAGQAAAVGPLQQVKHGSMLYESHKTSTQPRREAQKQSCMPTCRLGKQQCYATLHLCCRVTAVASAVLLNNECLQPFYTTEMPPSASHPFEIEERDKTQLQHATTAVLQPCLLQSWLV